jgi:hypothetical protein
MNAILSSLLLADVLPPPGLPGSLLENKPLVIGAGAGAAVFFLLVIVWISRGKKKVDPEGGLSENLGTYPPAPADAGQRLAVQGLPGRLRLVVVAPTGKKSIDSSDVEGLLNQVVRGLGDIARQDRPRVRIWPTQLSNQGFAPTFHRLTHRPEPAGRASPWVLLAGPAHAEGQQILLGMAFYADQANKFERLTLKPLEWGEVLAVQ